jgi:hypothetical protein
VKIPTQYNYSNSAEDFTEGKCRGNLWYSDYLGVFIQNETSWHHNVRKTKELLYREDNKRTISVREQDDEYPPMAALSCASIVPEHLRSHTAV